MSTLEAQSPEVEHLSDEEYQDQADFRYALRRFLRFSELQARRNGVTPQQHLLLLTVRGHPEYPRVSISDIAERMQVKHHSASLLVERTLRKGLVVRAVDGRDRRRALVKLTQAGVQMLDSITLANRAELETLEPMLFRSSFIETLHGNPGPRKRR